MLLRFHERGSVSFHATGGAGRVEALCRCGREMSDLRDRLAAWGETGPDLRSIRLDVARLREAAARAGTEDARRFLSLLDAEGPASGLTATLRRLPEPAPQGYSSGRAIVVGGTGAIGTEIVRLLAGRHVDVAFTTRRLEGRASALLDELCEGPADVEAHEMDIAESGAAGRLFERLRGEGAVHSVFFAAGIPVPQKYIGSVSWPEWQRAVDFEINGFFRVAQAALHILKESGGGSLVAMTTAATQRHPSRDGLSGAPKAAVEGLIRAIAREEGRFGIRANCVAPGLIEAGIGQAVIDELRFPRVLDGIRAGTPLRRLCTARDCAEAAVFLASNAASAITGHVLPVDCGFHV